MSVIRSLVAGCGAYLPQKVVTNADLATKMATSDEWIRQRTGIRQRHVAAQGELTSHLAINAAEAALADAGMTPDELDLIVLATTTPDETFPATATRVQAAIGMHHGMAFDVQAVCSGFVYALAVADNFIKVGQAKSALVIGAETFTRILDWNDRGTSVLFGDGAGAVALKAVESKGDKSDRGVLSTHLFSDGRYHDMLYVDGGPSSTGKAGFVRMEGREVFRHAVTKLAQAVDAAIAQNGVSESEIDWLVPHQANLRIIDSMGQRLKLPPEKVVVTIDRHANTSAASIPLALAEAKADGRIKPGQLVLLEAMGGGFTWGSALLRW
ncbi:3-oxoacyl-[acyl-carrier-protein] synthase 3 [Hypericibacter adhaerens]|uniref:Beta-ketoacyl-[acyl-carrier-protein] synthase III n=1 Tax=Hypericibacter adhaerens TaxID=2602016 RepID=A0A5J6N176_9PROT|nr:beta-ketoacyl-ACP synthase III [Hypericibacter adhaerens]QEX22705.1 3-oxoacyl-[acyl-carrier-protein] synthase 3 [Hypericibacter adhaerens]